MDSYFLMDKQNVSDLYKRQTEINIQLRLKDVEQKANRIQHIFLQYLNFAAAANMTTVILDFKVIGKVFIPENQLNEVCIAAAEKIRDLNYVVYKQHENDADDYTYVIIIN